MAEKKSYKNHNNLIKNDFVNIYLLVIEDHSFKA